MWNERKNKKKKTFFSRTGDWRQMLEEIFSPGNVIIVNVNIKYQIMK
jgi:hypothetical protein